MLHTTKLIIIGAAVDIFKVMKEAFAAYPELICLDATYKLLELGLPVYLMLCEDSNGQSEIICVCHVREWAGQRTLCLELIQCMQSHQLNITTSFRGMLQERWYLTSGIIGTLLLMNGFSE